MNTIQKIVKNVGLLFISQMLSYVFAFFTLIYTARYLGVEGFGILSSALALTSIFSVFMDLGLSTLTIRDVARNESLANKYVGNITTIKIILSLITLGIIFLVVNISNYNPQTTSVIYFIALYTVFTTFSMLFLAVFQANQKMEYQSLGTILSSIVLLAGVLLAIYSKFDIIQFSTIYTIVGALTLAYTIIVFSLKMSLPKMEFDFDKWKDLIRESWPFAITGISINIYIWIDTIILAFMQGQGAVGLYNASYKLVLVFLFIPVVFNTAIFPLMSQYYISSKYNLNISFQKLFKMMMIVAVPLGVGTVIIANKVILFIYGVQFIGAVIALQILIWSMVLIFARSPFERFLESSNRQLTVTKIFIIGVIFNIIFNLIFIPKFSYVAAAIITVLTDTLVLVLMIFTTKNLDISISNNSTISFLFKTVLASLIMGVTLKYLLNLNIFLLIIIGSLLYIAILLLLKIFDDDEILMIRKILNRGN
jgi:O-antigen/teichoic acid export membrane protein